MTCQVLSKAWAFLVVDVQNDFCPGGALGVKGGDMIVPVINEIQTRLFNHNPAQLFFSRDWHPAATNHFRKWPPHCVQGTTGAQFHPDLTIPSGATIISKGMSMDDDAYSMFDGICLDSGLSLDHLLKARNITHLVVAGLATDYCVRSTVLDARRNQYAVILMNRACRAVDDNTGDMAIRQMLAVDAFVTM